MFCPYCRNPDSRVIDSRTADDGAAIRRRRSCPGCGRRFTTQETVILMVSKRSGVTEPFTREKITNGVRRACQGRPVTEDQLAILAQRVEEAIRARGCAEVPSHDVGLAILGPLRELDEVAYLRFASVYRSFESLSDFEAEIATLRAAHAGTWPDEAGPQHGAGPSARPDHQDPPAVTAAAGLAVAGPGRKTGRAPRTKPGPGCARQPGSTGRSRRACKRPGRGHKAIGKPDQIPEGGGNDRDGQRVGTAGWQGRTQGADDAPDPYPRRHASL
jgi:transcriptional repressor NrdR